MLCSRVHVGAIKLRDILPRIIKWKIQWKMEEKLLLGFKALFGVLVGCVGLTGCSG